MTERHLPLFHFYTKRSCCFTDCDMLTCFAAASWILKFDVILDLHYIKDCISDKGCIP